MAVNTRYRPGVSGGVNRGSALGLLGTAGAVRPGVSRYNTSVAAPKAMKKKKPMATMSAVDLALPAHQRSDRIVPVKKKKPGPNLNPRRVVRGQTVGGSPKSLLGGG